MDDLATEKIGLKYQIWSKATKEGLVSEHHARRITFLTNRSKEELKVHKTIHCTEKTKLSKFLQATNLDYTHGKKINRNSKFYLWVTKNSSMSKIWPKYDYYRVKFWRKLEFS